MHSLQSWQAGATSSPTSLRPAHSVNCMYMQYMLRDALSVAFSQTSTTPCKHTRVSVDLLVDSNSTGGATHGWDEWQLA